MIPDKINRHKGLKVANGILIGEGLVCLLLLVYCIYYYGWRGERSFSSPVGPILFYGLPAIIASLSFAALRLRPSYRINLVLFTVSMNVLVLATELLLPFSYDTHFDKETHDRVHAARAVGITFDTRNSQEVVTALQKQGMRAVPTIAPGTFFKPQVDGPVQSEIAIHGTEVLPLVGISRTRTVFCNESGDYVLYESDERGFHNPQGLWQSRHIDNIALGDSFTIGACVPSDKNFVALIRRQWPATLNLGSNGVGPLFELAILKEYASFLTPRVVLWCYFEGNDLQNLQTEKASPLLMRYLEHHFTQGLLSLQPDLDQALTAYVDRVYHAHRPWSVRGLQSRVENVLKLSTLRLQLGLNYGLSRDERREVSEADMHLFRTVLLGAHTSVRSWGGSLYFVYLPNWPRYAGQGRIDKDRERVLTAVRSLDIPVIDVHGTFQAQRDPLSAFPFRLDSHYNELGHQLVAETILPFLSHGAEVTPSSGPSITDKGDMTGSLESKARGQAIEDLAIPY